MWVSLLLTFAIHWIIYCAGLWKHHQSCFVWSNVLSAAPCPLVQSHNLTTNMFHNVLRACASMEVIIVCSGQMREEDLAGISPSSITMFSVRENKTKEVFVKRTAQKYSYNHDFIMNANGWSQATGSLPNHIQWKSFPSLVWKHLSVFTEICDRQKHVRLFGAIHFFPMNIIHY